MTSVAAVGAAAHPGLNRFPRGRRADSLITLEPPGPGVSVFEPTIAIDPSNPDRIAVAAQYGVRGGRGGRNIQLWLTDDGGRRWHTTRVPRPKLDGEFAADPLVAFHADGGLITSSNFSRRWIADYNDVNSHSRRTVPTMEKLWDMQNVRTPMPDDLFTAGGIAVSRAEHGGRTLRGTVVPGISPLPFVTTAGATGWLLAYLADDRETSVVLLRSDDGRRFALDRTPRGPVRCP